ncbi:MAG: hypothetical protein WD005_00980, partial [Haliea sp.]
TRAPISSAQYVRCSARGRMANRTEMIQQKSKTTLDPNLFYGSWLPKSMTRPTMNHTKRRGATYSRLR